MGPLEEYDEFLYAFLFLFVAAVPFSCCIACCCSGTRRRQEEEPNDAAALAQRVVPVELQAWTLPAAAAAPPVVVRKKLRCFPYSAHVEEGGDDNKAAVCAICLEAFVPGATCSEVPACRHFFHQHCIEPWMRSKRTCPLCRAAIVPGWETLSAAQDMV